VRTIAALAAAASFTVALCRVSSSIDLGGLEISSPTVSATLPHKPEDWLRVFEQRLNAGDLDAVIALYEPAAHFIANSGETLAGHDAIRKALGSLIQAKTHFRSRVVRAVTFDNVAQLYTDFEGTRIDESGKTVPVHNNAVEVLRRQSEGSWKLIMGDPNGRK
jgi:uncharacterized protein (TIGR02246 family)